METGIERTDREIEAGLAAAGWLTSFAIPEASN